MSVRRRRRRGKKREPLPLAEIIEVTGALLITVGLWQVYHPLAWLWVGLAAFVASYLIERRAKHLEPHGPADRADGAPSDRGLGGHA